MKFSKNKNMKNILKSLLFITTFSFFFVFQSCSSINELNTTSVTSLSNAFEEGEFPLEAKFDSFIYKTCEQNNIEYNPFTFKLAALRDGSGLKLNPNYIKKYQGEFSSEDRRKAILQNQLSKLSAFTMSFSMKLETNFSAIRPSYPFHEAYPLLFLGRFPLNGKTSLNSSSIIDPLIDLSPDKSLNFFNELSKDRRLELSLNLRNISTSTQRQGVDFDTLASYILAVSYKGLNQKQGTHISPKEKVYEDSFFGNAYKIKLTDNENHIKSFTEYSSSSLENAEEGLKEVKRWKCEKIKIVRPQDGDECPRRADLTKNRIDDLAGSDYFDEDALRFSQAARELFDDKGDYFIYWGKDNKCAIPILEDEKPDLCYHSVLLEKETEQIDYSPDCDEEDHKKDWEKDKSKKPKYCGHYMSVCISS